MSDFLKKFLIEIAKKKCRFKIDVYLVTNIYWEIVFVSKKTILYVLIKIFNFFTELKFYNTRYKILCL